MPRIRWTEPSPFRQIEVGDLVRRRLGRDGPIMELKVSELSHDFIFCGPPGQGWKFDHEYGYEIDEELGWGVARPDGEGGVEYVTGSYLLQP